MERVTPPPTQSQLTGLFTSAAGHPWADADQQASSFEQEKCRKSPKKRKIIASWGRRK